MVQKWIAESANNRYWLIVLQAAFAERRLLQAVFELSALSVVFVVSAE